MWPFGRKREAAAPGPQPAPAPIIRREWTALPPIQRTIGEHPLTAPSDRFSEDLATHQDPSVSSDEMGHQVTAEAPAGIVLTLARTRTRSDGPAMIPRPRVQRRADGAVAESGEWDGDEAAPLEARSSPLPATAQRAAIMERPVVTPVADLPLLTALAPDADPVPIIAKPHRASSPLAFETPSEWPTPSAEPPPAPGARRLTLGQARRLGLGAPINKVPDRAIQRAAIEATPSPGTPALSTPTSSMDDAMSLPPSASQPAAPAPPAMNIQRTPAHADVAPAARPSTDSRRLELPLAPPPPTIVSAGEPVLATPDQPATLLPAVPESSVASHALGNTSSPRSTTSVPTVQAAFDPTLEPQSPPSSVTMPLLREQGGDVGVFWEPKAQPLRPPATAPGVATTSAAGTVAVDRTESPLAPLVGRQSIATLQRSVESPPAVGEPPSTRAQQGRSAPAVIEAPEGGNDLELAVDNEGQREGVVSFAGDAGQPSSHPFVQRLPVDTASDRPAATLTLPPRPMGTLTRPADERPAGREAATGWTLPLAPAPVIVQRIGADVSSGHSGWITVTAEPSLQREPSEAMAGEAPGGVSAGPSQAVSPNGLAAESHSPDADLDALAGKLYDRIRSRLKTELLVDRERAGFLTDLR